MTRKKNFAVLVFLTIISTIIGAINLDLIGTRIAMAAPIDLGISMDSDSCVNPTREEQRATCTDLEAQILAATIRIELLTWEITDGQHKQLLTESHATILDGKYLVTHNHFEHSLTEQVEEFGDKDGYSAIWLRTTDGRLILEYEALSSFTVAYDDAEILVLAFVDENGKGLFEAANLPSVEFADMESIYLDEGDELAQIDWDGETAHVDWVRVDNVNLVDNTPQIQVNNFPLEGSSGGGVFLNGIHVGINWMRNTKMNQDTGEITQRYSIIALNTAALVDLAQ